MPSLLEGEELEHSTAVGRCHGSDMGEVALLLLGLLRQDVALESMFCLDFSCSGKGEPLFGTGISLNLWHLGYFC